MMGSVLAFDDGMLEVVSGLKRQGVLTCLITNMNVFHVRYVRRHAPRIFLNFDHLMISSIEKVAKPDLEAWIRPMETLGLRAEECLFIDDSFNNIKAAAKLGIKVWHYAVTDEKFCLNGRLDEERKNFSDFIGLLTKRGIIKNPVA